MLVEKGIADAYGCGFEYVKNPPPNDLARYYKHQLHDTQPGCYTDDTQMGIAVAELILSDEKWTPYNIAKRFLDAFKRDPRKGYAKGFQKFLETTENADEFIKNMRPDSDKSGASMRACPVGFYPTISEVLEKTRLQAMITHNTPDGISAAQATALMAHYFIYNLGPKDKLRQFINSHLTPWTSENSKITAEWTGSVGAQGWMSVAAAITAISRHENLSGILKDCIDFGGDVDTVAAIALGAVSESKTIIKDLPICLYDGLEDTVDNKVRPYGEYGLTYLHSLDSALRTKFNTCSR